MRVLLLAFFFSTVLAFAAPGETTFTSETTRAHLLELFTSEGCSSCPPAEAWLSRLKGVPGLWREVVPLAFHVDYWDRLGWRDPFAAKAWTARQYRYSAAWGSGSVYTPGFVLDGREWRNGSLPARSTEEVGVLRLTLAEANRAVVKFSPVKAGTRALEAHVARLGFDVRIKVKAGENNGRELLHDFVVLALVDAPLRDGEARVDLPSGPGTVSRQAVVAWVTEAEGTTPRQATGGWLP